ncbi:hypothetical protein Dimus_006675 [Dionaea muscipula]
MKLALLVLFLVRLLLLINLDLVARSRATMYTVGGTSGWDPSTDLGSWVQGKTFVPGDVLLFEYSSYHSVCELSEENYERCNTTQEAALHGCATDGNTSISLTNIGEWYFACGNQLYCLGGMKLRVLVESNSNQSAAAASPAAADPYSVPLQQEAAANLIPPAASNAINPLSATTSASSSSAANSLFQQYSPITFMLLILATFAHLISYFDGDLMMYSS